MENLPKSLRIGANDYAVTSVRGLATGQGNWGEIDYGNTAISLEESLSESKTLDTLIHEMTHGILFEAGFEDHTEEQANRIAKVLATTLRDNDFGFMRKGSK